MERTPIRFQIENGRLHLSSEKVSEFLGADWKKVEEIKNKDVFRIENPETKKSLFLSFPNLMGENSFSIQVLSKDNDIINFDNPSILISNLIRIHLIPAVTVGDFSFSRQIRVENRNSNFIMNFDGDFDFPTVFSTDRATSASINFGHQLRQTSGRRPSHGWNSTGE
jgi:hypothetical protein